MLKPSPFNPPPSYNASDYEEVPRNPSFLRPLLLTIGSVFGLCLVFAALYFAYHLGLKTKEELKTTRLQDALTETAVALAPPPVLPEPEPVASPVVAAPAPPPPAPAPIPVVPLARVSKEEASMLLEKAKSSIQNGDISLARSYLERASLAEVGEAYLLLGETFDSSRLKAWNARGVRADTTRAKTYYEKALAFGDTLAKERLLNLK